MRIPMRSHRIRALWLLAVIMPFLGPHPAGAILWKRRACSRIGAEWLLVLALVAPNSAGAIEHIRGEQWSYPEALAPSPQLSRVSLTFSADLTARDFDHGVEVRIDSSTPLAPETTPILRFFRLVPTLLPGVATASFAVSFDLECNEAGDRIRVTNPECWMHYNWRGLAHIDVVGAAAVEAAGTFGLVVRDEHGEAGAQPLASDRLHCNDEDRSIGVYFDPQGTLCHGTIRPGTPGTVYILAKLPPGADGIAGAEFRFTGAPDSWQLFAVPNPAIITIGDPFGQGVTIGFSCQRPEKESSPSSVLVLAGSEETDLVSDSRAAIGTRAGTVPSQ